MEFLDKWERKLGWMSFPGLLKYYALFHVMVFLLQFVNPQIGQVLAFDRDKIMAGEVWRALTFLVADSGFKGLGGFAMLFLFFMVMIAFMMSDALEGAWGTLRTSLFHYTAFAGLLIANFLYGVPMTGSGLFVYTSAFFAFATLFPRHEFLMFLIIPLQVRWLAILLGGLMLLGVLGQPLYLGYLVLAFGNYLLWAGIPAMRGRARAVESAGRKRKYEKGKISAGQAFHRCVECGRTELSDPDLEFRMAEDGKEYCEDHLEG
jgi:hypothetical protein